MAYEIDVLDVQAHALVSIKRRVAWPELGAQIRARLDVVWPFIRANRLAFGHNVCVYRDADARGCELECGVQIRSPFEPDGEIVRGETPSGRAAHVTHRGPYHELGRANDALDARFHVEGWRGGPSWEVYGDHVDDESQLVTEVYRLIT
jgi:effector-binding domain-containing protein